MMPLQRTCDAENQVRNKLSNGPLRAQSNGTKPEYSATQGRRDLPGICWYLAKRTGHTVKQGGTADAASNCSFALDRKESVEGFFVALGSIPEG